MEATVACCSYPFRSKSISITQIWMDGRVCNQHSGAVSRDNSLREQLTSWYQVRNDLGNATNGTLRAIYLRTHLCEHYRLLLRYLYRPVIVPCIWSAVQYSSGEAGVCVCECVCVMWLLRNNVPVLHLLRFLLLENISRTNSKRGFFLKFIWLSSVTMSSILWSSN